jgi:hypothetical protein
MPRAIVYDRPVKATSTTAAAHVDAASASDHTPDGYWEKLAKYVPAEAIAFFTPLVAVWSPSHMALGLMIVLGAIANFLVLFGQSITLPTTCPRPHWYFYLLATVAFVAWALGTNRDVQALLGMNPAQAGSVLGMVVFFVPRLDDLCVWSGQRLQRGRRALPATA